MLQQLRANANSFIILQIEQLLK